MPQLAHRSMMPCLLIDDGCVGQVRGLLDTVLSTGDESVGDNTVVTAWGKIPAGYAQLFSKLLRDKIDVDRDPKALLLV